MMTLDELIAQLQAIRADHGDIDVRIHVDEGHGFSSTRDLTVRVHERYSANAYVGLQEVAQ